MIPSIRKKFNRDFTETNYKKYINEINNILEYPADFRLSETPVFLTEDLTALLIDACDEIIKQIQLPAFKGYSKNAVPSNWNVPGETEHPDFLQIDFGITKDENGKYIPKLIELQGFPSLYGFQFFLNRVIREYFDIPIGFTPYFNGYDEEQYAAFFRDIVLNGHSTENVVLLDIQPEKQKTRIDFAATKKLTGIEHVCISKVSQVGRKLYYLLEGKEKRIERIYNRVIFDELTRAEIKPGFSYTDDLNIEWAGHPNWFYKISKYSLPFIKSKYAPNAFFLKSIYDSPVDLSHFVLKPLYSFAGLGVEVEVTKEMIDKIEHKENYILQEKIEYAPVIETPDGYSKFEIRMMFLWKDKPVLVNNLIRMSKGKMMGVDYNKNKTWVGSSLAFHQ